MPRNGYCNQKNSLFDDKCLIISYVWFGMSSYLPTFVSWEFYMILIKDSQTFKIQNFKSCAFQFSWIFLRLKIRAIFSHSKKVEWFAIKKTYFIKFFKLLIIYTQ